MKEQFDRPNLNATRPFFMKLWSLVNQPTNQTTNKPSQAKPSQARQSNQPNPVELNTTREATISAAT
jgi:hypothetical protein